MKTTQIHLIIGMSDCRPNAKATPRGIDRQTAIVPNKRLSIKPPISREGNNFKCKNGLVQTSDITPDTPPNISSNNTNNNCFL